MKPFLAYILAIAVFCSFVTLSGCASLRNKTPSLKVKTHSGTRLDQKGDVKEQPKVDTANSNTEIPLPKDSQIVIIPATATEPQKITVTLPAESAIKTSTISESINGAQSFGPPSTIDIAKGNAVQFSFILGGVLLIIGLALVYMQHYKAAGFMVAASFVVPASTRFLSSDKAMLIGGILVAISCTLVASYYIMTHKFELFP